MTEAFSEGHRNKGKPQIILRDPKKGKTVRGERDTVAPQGAEKKMEAD